MKAFAAVVAKKWASSLLAYVLAGLLVTGVLTFDFPLAAQREAIAAEALHPIHAGIGEHPRTYANSPRGTIFSPSNGFRLEPANPRVPTVSKIADAGQALAFLASNSLVPSADETFGGPTVAYGYFTNDGSGRLQPDGSLKLIDVHQLSWLFIWKLRGDAPGTGAPIRKEDMERLRRYERPYAPGHCFFSAFVTTRAHIPIAGWDCSHGDEPLFLVK